MASRVTTAVAITAISTTSTRRPPSATVRAIQPGRSKLRELADTYMTNPACTTKCTPNDMSSMVKSLAPRTQRNATSSSATDVAIEVATITGTRTHQSIPTSAIPYAT